jgi:hypothetical protein
MVFDPENMTANGVEHGLQNTRTTLWPDCHLEIASQGERLTKGLQICAFLRRPYTEEDDLEYVLPGVKSNRCDPRKEELNAGKDNVRQGPGMVVIMMPRRTSRLLSKSARRENRGLESGAATVGSSDSRRRSQEGWGAGKLADVVRASRRIMLPSVTFSACRQTGFPYPRWCRHSGIGLDVLHSIVVHMVAVQYWTF